MVKHIRIFSIIKYQKIINIVCVYLKYYYTQYFFNSDKEYYPHTFLEQCRYAMKIRKKKKIKLISRVRIK